MRSLLLALGVLFLAAPVRAWGPHPEITEAALATLPPDDPLRAVLGAEIGRLRDYCWMGDWRRTLRRETNVWFYCDDYLLFPTMLTHRDHLCPEVKQTYEPCFRRALQALRTETAANAARWLGGILHFTEDTGSPPHAAEIRGDMHSKMENWVQAKAIALGDYQPQLLGATDDDAVAGFLRRMDGLIEFSKQRAERARPFVVAGDRESTEPIVLESALETSRVVADLLHTLGHLARQIPAAGTTLRGRISSQAPVGVEKLPAKLVLLGTPYSTLADADGRYEFRGLPPGVATLGVLRPGCANGSFPIAIPATGALEQDCTLKADAVPGNWLRDATLDLAWLAQDRPEAWYPAKSKIEGPHWQSEVLPVKVGSKYQVRIAWRDGTTGQVVVRLSGSPDKLPVELAPLTPGNAELTFEVPPGTLNAQLLVLGAAPPGSVCRHLALVQIP
jgi:hypothetical protein